MLNKFNLLYILFCEGNLLIAKGTVYNKRFDGTSDVVTVVRMSDWLGCYWGRHFAMSNEGKMPQR